ncbi:MAG: hypothetical protein HYW91_00475 [Candidatus Sungbacteria bacterium]|nr:hypothetical protein [Candidatus Sungbacteria bacterium]
MSQAIIIAVSILGPPLVGVALRKIWFYASGQGPEKPKQEYKRPSLKVFEPGYKKKDPYAEE